MPQEPNDFEEYFNKYRHTPDIIIRSKSWFDQQVRILSGVYINERKLFSKSTIDDHPVNGKMYLYTYDPKFKKTLPYYDTFPLVIPYHIEPDRFIGLNFHYLSYYNRIRLFSRMMQFATSSGLSDSNRITYTWSLIAGVAKYKLANHCIKEYLFDHVRSRFIVIKPKDWYTAMMLPVARFKKKNQLAIWQENT